MMAEAFPVLENMDCPAVSHANTTSAEFNSSDGTATLGVFGVTQLCIRNSVQSNDEGIFTRYLKFPGICVEGEVNVRPAWLTLRDAAPL